jgi:hypothetical protein
METEGDMEDGDSALTKRAGTPVVKVEDGSKCLKHPVKDIEFFCN